MMEKKYTTYDVDIMRKMVLQNILSAKVMDASKNSCYLVAENEKLNLDGNYVFGHLSELYWIYW